MEKQKKYQEITQRYCSYLDDNVIISKYADSNPDEYVCLSSHLCDGHSDCKRKKGTKDTAIQ